MQHVQQKHVSHAIDSTPELLVRSGTADFAVATMGNVVFLHWRRAVVAEGVVALADAMSALAGPSATLAGPSGGGRFGFMTSADTDCSAVTPPDARQLLAALLRTHDRNIHAAAIVYEGRGFQATLVRSSVTAINLLSRTSFPNRVFERVPPASAWLSSQRGLVSVSAGRLVEAVDRLRSKPASA